MSEVKHTPGKTTLISKEHVSELNEKHGWFKFGDAQSDVSNAFANEAIERYERIRSAAPELLEALRIAVRQNDNDMLMTGEELRICYSAIAKATGVQP